MDYLLVCTAALLAAGLTLFSGFGLGSLLLPAFLPFLPPTAAVAATALVHLANNLFKLALLGRFADRRTVLVFGLPAALAAFGGALLLDALADLAPIGTYSLGGRAHALSAVDLVLGCLIAGFALFDLVPRLQDLRFDRSWLPLGGVLSGFFGGLSGHQGALRSAFLVKLDLSKEAFLGTGIACAVIVDLVRLPVYAGSALPELGRGELLLVGAATASAFAGSYVGRRMVDRVTIRGIRVLVGVLLLLLGAALAAGLLGGAR